MAFGLWLNQKGRVLADSYALRIGEQEVWLFSQASAATVIRERLEAYIIADDVLIDDFTSSWRGLVLVGEDAKAWLSIQVGGALPDAGEFRRIGEGFVFRGWRGEGETWEWLSPEPFPGADDLPELSGSDMERLRIVAGIPLVPVDIGPGELPNEGGLDATAVSYTKGCYLGQEVMARLKAMGKVRRRLMRVAGSGPAPEPLPAPLYQGAKKVGELRSLAPTGEGRFAGLALCTLLGLVPEIPLSGSAEAPGNIQLLDTP